MFRVMSLKDALLIKAITLDYEYCFGAKMDDHQMRFETALVFLLEAKVPR